MSYRLPAEWEAQDAVMLTWPHGDTDWRPFLTEVNKTYIEIATAITERQQLVLVFHSEALKQEILALLTDAKIDLAKVHSVVASTNDTWARDHGPVSVYDNDKLVALDFTFTGWGNKFDAELDDQINSAVFAHLLNPNAASQKVNLVLEGGGIESDGEGTLLTTSECLLNKNRNPDLSKQEIEQTLSNVFGTKHFLWLNNGYLAGDDTDSHIDTLARLAPNNAIVYVGCHDENDEHFAALSAMKAELVQFKTQAGEAYTLYELPWPSPKYSAYGDRLPATYANYLIINGAVLVPTYQDENDSLALSVIQKAHPEHQVIGINCLSLIEQFGSLHCITMQLPAGFLRS